LERKGESVKKREDGEKPAGRKWIKKQHQKQKAFAGRFFLYQDKATSGRGPAKGKVLGRVCPAGGVGGEKSDSQ